MDRRPAHCLLDLRARVTCAVLLCILATACTGEIEFLSPAVGADGGAPPTTGDNNQDGLAPLGTDTSGFGYPVGDRTTYPAGGFYVTQVLGHYWAEWVEPGRHLAQDLSKGFDGSTRGEPVYSVANGVVRYAGPNSSSYLNVILIEHELDNGDRVCSFYGHITEPLVATGEEVIRGQKITTIADWALTGYGGSGNSHLHYVFLSEDLCDASAEAGGQLICGYDKGGRNDIESLEDEPYSYTSVRDKCGVSVYRDAFISPTQLIEDNHFAR